MIFGWLFRCSQKKYHFKLPFQAGYLEQVVGQREVAVETTPEALNVAHSEPASTGSVETETSAKQVSAKEVETVEQKTDTSDTSDTREPRGTTVGPDPETQKLSDPEQDEQGEQDGQGEQGDADTEGRDLHAHCGKETQDFQRARVHQARLRTVERFRDGKLMKVISL